MKQCRVRVDVGRRSNMNFKEWEHIPYICNIFDSMLENESYLPTEKKSKTNSCGALGDNFSIVFKFAVAVPQYQSRDSPQMASVTH